jgi:hypothetical protein
MVGDYMDKSSIENLIWLSPTTGGRPGSP